MLAVAAVTTPDLYDRNNLTLILFLAGLIGVTAVGQTIVLLTGGIDLSIGAVIGLTTVIVATQTDGRGSALPGAIALARAGGPRRRRRQRRPRAAARGAAVRGHLRDLRARAGRDHGVDARRPVGEIPDALAPIGADKLAGIPVPLWLFAAIAAVAALVLSRTSLGAGCTPPAPTAGRRRCRASGPAT